ncbi:MAG: AsmA family protein [Alphaproteobacteria bacterium]
MKKVAIGLGSVLVVAIGAALLAPSFIDWNAYKPRIAAAGEAALGRPIAIDGPIAVRLLPQPTAEIRNVRLGNIPGGSAPDMARVESISLRIAILPLVTGRIEIGSVRIVRPEVLFETLADGRDNWTFAKTPESRTPESRTAGQTTGQPSAAGGSPPAIALDDVRIEAGRVTYRDARTDRVEVAEAIDLRLSAGSLDGPFAVNGTANLRGQAIAIEAQSGTLGEGAAPIRVAVRFPQGGLAARIEGTAALVPVPRINARLAADVTSPSQLAAILGSRMPVTKPLALTTRIEGDEKAIAINDIEIKLGDAVINGAARLENGAQMRGDIKMRGDILLVAGRIDLDGLLGADQAAPAPGRRAAPSGPATTPSRGTPSDAAAKAGAGFTLPRDLEIAADIGIDALVYNREAIRDVKLIGRLHDGRIDVEQIGARLPGDARLAMAGNLTVAGGEPKFRGRIDASADSLRDTLQAFDVSVGSVPGDRLRRFALRSAIEADTDDIRLQQIDAGIDASRVTGALSFKAGARPRLGAALVIDRLDLDAYLAGSSPSAVPRSAAPALSSPAQAPVQAPARTGAASPLDPLLAADLDLNADLRVGRLGYAGVAIRDAHVDFGLAPGALTLRRLTVADLGGASLDASGVLGIQTTDLKVAARAATIGGLFRLAGIEPPVSPDRLGAVSVDADIKGTLADLALAARIEAAGATTDLKGRAGLAGAPTYALDLATGHPELGQFIRTFAPTYRARAGNLGPAAVSGKIVGAPGRLDVTDLKFQAGPTVANGSVAIRFDGARPHVSADLVAGDIVVDRFLPAERRAALDRPVRVADAGAQPIQLAQAAAGRWSAAALDLSSLRDIDADLKLRAGGVAYQTLRLTRIETVAMLANGVLDLGHLTGGLWGGSLEGHARLDARAEPRASVDIRLDKARLHEAGLVSEDGVGVTEGTANLVAAWTASGASEAALVRSLAGKADLQVTDGVLNGLNLRAISDRLKRIDQVTDLIALAQAGMQGGNTPFSALTGTFVAERGVVRTSDLRLVADAAAGDGTATIDLPAWTLQSRSAFRLVEHPNAPAVGFRLEGALDKPRRFIETDALQQYLVQRGVGRLLQRGLGGGQTPQTPQSPAGQQPGSGAQKPEDVLRGLLRGLGR